MTTPLRLLAALAALGSAGACLVSTNDLAPKTAAQCEPWEKPCGNRCVNAGDPATGCGNAGCEPVDLSTDAGHCGACGHACLGGGCAAAVCEAQSISRGTPDLRGITVWGGDLYWLEGASGGQLVRWSSSTPFTAGNVSTVVAYLDPRTSPSVAPSANRIASGPSRLYVAGSGGVPTSNLTVWEIDPGASSKTSRYTDVAISAAAVDGIAATPDGVYFTRSDTPGLFFTDLGGAVASTVTTGGDPHGLAVSGSDVYYGYSQNVGTLARATHAGGESWTFPNANAEPDRLAVVQSGGVTKIFFASEVDGRVHALDGTTLGSIYAGSGLPNPIDIAADAAGAYFYDRAIGELLEWRADGWFFPLARNVQPFGVAVDGTHVYWTDASGAVMRVPK